MSSRYIARRYGTKGTAFTKPQVVNLFVLFYNDLANIEMFLSGLDRVGQA
jgi:hypothetical protein